MKIFCIFSSVVIMLVLLSLPSPLEDAHFTAPPPPRKMPRSGTSQGALSHQVLASVQL